MKKYEKLICGLCIIVLLFSLFSTDVVQSKSLMNGNLIQQTEEEQNTGGDSTKESDKKSTEEKGTAKTPNLDITAQAAVLIEGSTGEILYEKNKDEQLRPASITKIMTLLLIYEALEEGKISLTDEVSVSEHAASMGGSQVFLEPFESQTVETMLKCISIASANDASVAMAEFLAGSEEEFVNRMNERAKELGMNNTHFVNACGLDEDNHYSSAYDVALMSRELIINHPEVSKFSTIWMDTFVHTTKKGKTEFGLTNTNKLIRTYDGITGLKTGSTKLAKYSLSATAKRNSMDLIAVVMAAPDYKIRFSEASKLLDYGFANCSVFADDNKDLKLEPLKIKKSVKDTLNCEVGETFSYICLKGVKKEDITKEVTINEEIVAPIAAGDKVGEVTYSLNGSTIGSVPIVATESIEKASYKDYFVKVLDYYFIKK
ncbi:D-alanyl-D-alanine carboxypeptidase (penicillin-binding protein 5/6) [Mobilisporobacter senegalensis]|uniref:serine-type D-Ala-D-Ala carboxypeptidase n=1 Tax=Mobilisporobacter senegalensis TaxID=1329262 RepID=A0A3N1X6E1_9FIRM|nr:D-alanyl-D-alanine carboxypeptidase family protein [Mobilisporobacter senegalensis]ROR22343.1 D-alanyl-D-alanine carboxypeptidase (penicillin-binding protein 5/6) [Mobilisporobacter senegalensis]